ncbi:MAG: stalk domain-containing protein, partial [Candidatus Velthaea sp.]
VDGRPVAPAPRGIVLAGRTLVPLRSLAAALGARVDYDAATRTVTVQRNGRRVAVAAPFVNQGHAYVPLRTAAEALGFGVGFDAATHAIALRSARRPAPPAPVAVATPEAPPPIAAAVTQKFPQPGGAVADAFPAISARVEPQGGAPVDVAAIRLWIDGTDVTGNATVIGDEIVYTPRAPLAAGAHDVRVAGTDRGGVPFAADWRFTSNYVPPSTAASGSGLSSVFVDRVPVPGERYFDVIAYGPPGGYGYVTIDGVPGEFSFVQQGISRYVAHVYLPEGIDQAYAHAYVHYTDAHGGVVNYTIPSPLRLYTIFPAFRGPQPTAQPLPAPLATSTPAIPHRTFVRPMPTPAPSPDATRVPVLLIRPVASPSPAPPPVHKRVPLTNVPASMQSGPAVVETPHARVLRARPSPSPSPSISAAPAPRASA